MGIALERDPEVLARLVSKRNARKQAEEAVEAANERIRQLKLHHKDAVKKKKLSATHAKEGLEHLKSGEEDAKDLGTFGQRWKAQAELEARQEVEVYARAYQAKAAEQRAKAAMEAARAEVLAGVARLKGETVEAKSST